MGKNQSKTRLTHTIQEDGLFFKEIEEIYKDRNSNTLMGSAIR